jgi:hypothetical protein
MHAMRELPILFSGAMVRALLDGSKTQTRRVVNPQPWADARSAHYHPSCPSGSGGMHPASVIFSSMDQCVPPWAAPQPVRCPFGEPGDRLYVRETFLYVGPGSGSDLPIYREERANPENHTAENCWYRASRPDETLVWTPSIHMPRWASRISLEVTGVRVERLQDISAADARAEGIEFQEHRIAGDVCRSWKSYGSANGWYPEGVDSAPIFSYRSLWDTLNAARGYGWDANPWVWVVEFDKC